MFRVPQYDELERHRRCWVLQTSLSNCNVSFHLLLHQRLPLHYGEVSRVLRHLRPLSADQVAERAIHLYRRHSSEVTGLMDAATSAHASDIREGKLLPTCAILLAIPESYKKVEVAEKWESSDAPVDSATPVCRDGSPPLYDHSIKEIRSERNR